MGNNCVEKRYPVGIQSFSEIRKGGFVYVDKTAYIHRLIQEGKYYFLSRPRRFGKSLLISTIEAYFNGEKEFFDGLAIDSLTEEWERHPVMHIDLNSEKYDSVENLDQVLNYYLNIWENKYNVHEIAKTLSQRFANVIRAAYEITGRGVVILIDEYDKPMLNAIDNPSLADIFRENLKAFYGNLKSQDRYIKFAMLTGVARFSKVSIFSDLNNLRDISFEPKFSTICGITNEELKKYFADGIQCLANANGKTFEEMSNELHRLYDGYHFSEDLQDIYNPYSLVNVFASNKLSNYWIASGTPTYITKLLKRYKRPLRDLENCKIKATKLITEGIMTKEVTPTLYQAGYLTIKDYNETYRQ